MVLNLFPWYPKSGYPKWQDVRALTAISDEENAINTTKRELNVSCFNYFIMYCPFFRDAEASMSLAINFFSIKINLNP